ncbi:MAG: nicotinate-nucleotide--dimethylbenzimidazole phosphoribosyltransferase, partial [Rhodospirillales bacterium]|nr:nicotinate-nucleotide--dimethylbenzimidazole phosphoribosyltransferase [Rhodospirillales bacterium]
MTDAPNSIDAILARLALVPAAGNAAIAQTKAREATLTKPPGALGRLEEVSEWLAGWQDRSPPRIDKAAVVVFAGNHGVAARGVSAFPAEVTAQMVANFEAGGAAVNQLSRTAGAEFKVIPIDLDRPTDDFTEAPAMSEADFIAAFAIGWRALEDGVDLLCVGEMGIANTTSAAALCHALFGGRAEDWTGPGTGVSGQALSKKATVVADAVTLH